MGTRDNASNRVAACEALMTAMATRPCHSSRALTSAITAPSPPSSNSPTVANS